MQVEVGVKGSRPRLEAVLGVPPHSGMESRTWVSIHTLRQFPSMSGRGLLSGLPPPLA